MTQTREEKRLAQDLYDRIWSQRQSARMLDETLDVDGHPTAMRTITLSDGLRIGYFHSDKHPVRGATVVLILPDRTMPLDFVDPWTMERCRTSVFASMILHAAGLPDAPNGRPVRANFRSAHHDVLPRPHALKTTEEYLIGHLDTIVARGIDEISADHRHVLAFTLPSGLSVRFRSDDRDPWGRRCDNVWVGHVALTCRIRLGRKSLRSYAAWRRSEAARILCGSLPVPLAPPPDTAGSARLTRALDLCHQALKIDPDLADYAGTPLRPLLEEHVPELLARHRQASTTADARDIEAIDAELEDGIAGICDAIDQGLSRIADDRRHALREQLAFLEMRHPAPDGLLGIASGG
jgi:hypothetical protein